MKATAVLLMSVYALLGGRENTVKKVKKIYAIVIILTYHQQQRQTPNYLN